MSVAAAVFDMDGIIFDTERLAFEAFARASHEAGREASREAFIASIGLPRGSIPAKLTEVLGPDFPAMEVIDRSYDLLEEAVARDGPPLKPGIVDALDALAARDIPAAVATSTDTGVARDYLASTDLLGRFVAVVGGDLVERGKPAPDIFLRSATALGVDAAGTIVFEDSPSGVRAAAAAGMRVVMVPDFIAPDDALRPLIFAVLSSLHDAAQRVEELLR